MQITRNSFVYKTAYVFADADKRPLGNINGCIFFWRFIFCGLLYLLYAIIFFPVTLFVSFVIMSVRWIFAILIGRRLEHYRQIFPENDRLDTILNHVWPGNWRSVRINSWPTLFGWRILPIGVVAIISACCFVGLIIYLNWVVGSLAVQGDFSALTMLIGEIVIAACILAGFSASAIRNSSVGQLISANVRSFKDRTCPVVEIID